MDLDTIKVEAHYGVILSERCKLILQLYEQVEMLTKENEELKIQVQDPSKEG